MEMSRYIQRLEDGKVNVVVGGEYEDSMITMVRKYPE
jgi:hypothetical protein